MYQHILNLLFRSWDNFTNSLGSTTLGFFAPPFIVVAGAFVLYAIKVRRLERPDVKSHLRQLLSDGAIATGFSAMLVYGAIFLWHIPKTIYDDHILLSKEVSEQYEMINGGSGKKGLLSENVELHKKIEGPDGFIAQLKDANRNIAELKERLDEEIKRSKPSGASSSSRSEERDPNAFYQLGQQVADTVGSVPDLAHSKIFFPKIIESDKANPSRDFEFQKWIIHCPITPNVPPPNSVVGIMEPQVFFYFTCNIVRELKK